MALAGSWGQAQFEFLKSNSVDPTLDLVGVFAGHGEERLKAMFQDMVAEYRNAYRKAAGQ